MFQQTLVIGNRFERGIGNAIAAHGGRVVMILDTGAQANGIKPKMTLDGKRSGPPADLWVFREGNWQCVEVKGKGYASWYIKGKRWQFGCDQRVFDFYTQTAKALGIPFSIVFPCVGTGAEPDGATPQPSNVVFQAPLEFLAANVDHSDDGGSNIPREDWCHYWNADELPVVGSVFEPADTEATMEVSFTDMDWLV